MVSVFSPFSHTQYVVPFTSAFFASPHHTKHIHYSTQSETSNTVISPMMDVPVTSFRRIHLAIIYIYIYINVHNSIITAATAPAKQSIFYRVQCAYFTHTHIHTHIIHIYIYNTYIYQQIYEEAVYIDTFLSGEAYTRQRLKKMFEKNQRHLSPQQRRRDLEQTCPCFPNQRTLANKLKFMFYIFFAAVSTISEEYFLHFSLYVK